MNIMAETTIEADPKVPIIRLTRDFAATPEQLFRAHTDPRLFVQWNGPNSLQTRIDHWDARSGGSFRFVSSRDGEDYAFRRPSLVRRKTARARTERRRPTRQARTDQALDLGAPPPPTSPRGRA